MNIVLTYDPRWEYTPQDQTPIWASLDTVAYVTELLEDCGCSTILCKADHQLETNLQEILNKYSRSLVFWLNEFISTDSGKEVSLSRLLNRLV